MRPSVKSKKATAKKKTPETSKSGVSILAILAKSFVALGNVVIWTCKTPFALLSVVVVVGVILLVSYDVPQKTYRFVEHHMARLSVKADVQLKHVYLEGQNHTQTESLLEQMDVKIGMPLFAIDLEAIRQRLEALPWVRYAEVERQYPSTLTVRIVERTPVALWQFDQKLRLLDSEGVVIEVEDISAFSDYLIIVGENIPYYLIDVMELLESEESLKPMVSSLVRVSDRRWDVVLHNNIRVMLPEYQPDKMWSYLAQLHSEKNILSDYDIKSINLKIPEKIFIERASEQKKKRSSKGRKNT